MNAKERVVASSAALRQELSAINLVRGASFDHELTFGKVASVLYRQTPSGLHGNFIPASYKRICADEQWSRRLKKAYTSSSHIARSWERRRSELDCATSSDALLMNVFCYPRLLCSERFCSFLGVDRGLRPNFGVRANLAMRNGEVDRTELDMKLGSIIVEAKLTEQSFVAAARSRALRYSDLEDVFDVDELPWKDDKVNGYQLIRGVLAAYAQSARYVLLCDGRRADLQETYFRVLRAVRSCEVRSRMALLTWQELARHTPGALRRFLREKYGIQNEA